MHELDAPVAALLRSVAASAVLPRFRNLTSGDIEEKSPGELVTIADRDAEEQLTTGLLALGQRARVVGEEACAVDPALLSDLATGSIWLVDPLDGTANFAVGREPFGLMIALLVDGVAEAGWLYDPVRDRMCHAARGRGAFIDEVAVRVGQPPPGRPVASLATQFMTAALRARVEQGFAEIFELVPIPRCAAAHYPRLVLGENQISLFQRTLPWDHAAGALFLIEAGGHVARWDGSPYRVGDGKIGILAGSSGPSWLAARALTERLGLPGEYIDAVYAQPIIAPGNPSPQ